MIKAVAMGTRADRLRHTIGFEIIGLALMVAGGAMPTGLSGVHLEVVSVVEFLVATV